MNIANPTSSYAILRRALRYLSPYRAEFICALLAMFIYGASDGAVPYLLKRILDDVFGSQQKQMLYVLVLAIIVFAAVRGVFGFLQRYLMARVGLNIVRDMRCDIHQHLLRQSSAFYLKQSSGALISRLTNDTLLVRTAIAETFGAVLRDSVRIVSLITVALCLDPKLGLIAMLGVPLALWPVFRFGRKVRKLSRVGQDQLGGLTSLLQETILGHRVVQAFSGEEYEKKRFALENERFTATFRRAERYGALAGPTNEILGSLAIAAVILYGGISVIEGVRTQGDFIAFITSMFLLYEPIKNLSRINNTLQLGAAAAERIFELLDQVPEILDSAHALELRHGAHSIKIRDVSFTYQAQGLSTEESQSQDAEKSFAEPKRLALRKLSLEIPAGETLALVGKSGSGKSTLAQLIPRFFDVTEGEILVDGVDVRNFSLTSLRREIAVVQQNTFLFNDTVFNNIAYGLPETAEEQVYAAARAAHAEQFIARLPAGYHTIIGEQGFTLSGGERARLSIARALLRDAPILILDEATANLDSESEILVQEAIERLMQGRTVLVIAHRLATVRRANCIAVLRDGELVEMGRHEELLRGGGEYSRLYRLQYFEDAASDGLNEPSVVLPRARAL